MNIQSTALRIKKNNTASIIIMYISIMIKYIIFESHLEYFIVCKNHKMLRIKRSLV